MNGLVLFLNWLGRLLLAFFRYRESAQSSEESKWRSQLETNVDQLENAKTTNDKKEAAKSLADSVHHLNPK
jgi:hypothetical protein